jgi:hypothetical protein
VDDGPTSSSPCSATEPSTNPSQPRQTASGRKCPPQPEGEQPRHSWQSAPPASSGSGHERCPGQGQHRLPQGAESSRLRPANRTPPSTTAYCHDGPRHRPPHPRPAGLRRQWPPAPEQQNAAESNPRHRQPPGRLPQPTAPSGRPRPRRQPHSAPRPAPTDPDPSCRPSSPGLTKEIGAPPGMWPPSPTPASTSPATGAPPVPIPAPSASHARGASPIRPPGPRPLGQKRHQLPGFGAQDGRPGGRLLPSRYPDWRQATGSTLDGIPIPGLTRWRSHSPDSARRRARRRCAGPVRARGDRGRENPGHRSDISHREGGRHQPGDLACHRDTGHLHTCRAQWHP